MNVVLHPNRETFIHVERNEVIVCAPSCERSWTRKGMALVAPTLARASHVVNVLLRPVPLQCLTLHHNRQPPLHHQRHHHLQYYGYFLIHQHYNKLHYP